MNTNQTYSKLEKYNIIVFLLCILLILSNVLLAQNNRVVKGVVLDHASLAPLEGVEIKAKISNTVSGSQTDGIYAIPLGEKDSVLVFQFENYEPVEIKVGNENDLNVYLKKTLEKKDQSDLSKLEGFWRATIKIRPDLEVPIQFKIRKTSSDWTADLINAEEHFPTGILKVIGDSIFIPLPLFENEFALGINNNILEGKLRRQDLKGNGYIVKAEKGPNYRFLENGSSPVIDITGKYLVTFKSANGKEEEAVGIFKQKGNRVTATFLRITGDSRYLDGIIEDNQIRLSSFIGSVPSLYTATVGADGVINGENHNARGSSPFTAVPNKNASLPDAYKLTKLNNGKDQIHFKFPDENNQIISNEDERFKGKPLIIAIGGTWCPNCIDEANFLGPWYKKNKSRGIEVVGLQYERQTDAPYVKKAFERFKKQFGIEYPLLIGGVADKQIVVGSLPDLENFLSFPTTIFVGRDGKVKKIHTGFTGPATGQLYQDFIKEFNEEADLLLKQ